MDHGSLYIFLAAVFGFFMAWGVGANDVANAMGTSVGSKALTLPQAIIIATVFEMLGALLAGGQVTETIRGRIIDVSVFTEHTHLLIDGMLASLLAAGTWLIVASSFGWPVSTTHSIVGAVIGFGMIALGTDAIDWSSITNIAFSWVVTPLIAALLAYWLFRSVQHFIFCSPKPIHDAKRYVPWYVFAIVFIIVIVVLTSGLQNLGQRYAHWKILLITLTISMVLMHASKIWLKKIPDPAPGVKINVSQLEGIFSVLMIFTACAMAFAHGSNDVANAIGPLAAVIGIVESGGKILTTFHAPLWIMSLGAIGIVSGLIMYGYKVIATVGSEITTLTPSRGFVAQFATASTVIISSGLGLPVSTTQILVGAILGVGYARGIAALNLSVIRNIFMSWIITLPAGAICAIFYFFLLRKIL